MAIMLQGVLRMPLPDNPADLDPMMWAQIRDRMREAADEIERLHALLKQVRENQCGACRAYDDLGLKEFEIQS